MGLHRTVHAGEGAGPPSIWGALERLEAERIDHGTRAGEDPKLVEYLAEHRIPLNMCLTSNLALGVVCSLAEHPAWKYCRAGIPVTLGTDDPSFFGTTLSRECFLFAQTFNLSMEDLRQIQRNALGAAFLAEKDLKIGGRTGLWPGFRLSPE
jgi:adenosine deaminase